MLLRPGNAGSSTVADHIAVLAAAVRQIPARFRSRLLVRVDGAGASHELIAHLLSLAGRRRTVLFTCGWMITEADEQAIRLLPATAWQAAVDQDGTVQENRHVAEVTHLMSRAVGWPAGLRWIVRRTKPSRRQMKNLTAFERSAGWRYSDIDLEITPTALASDVAGLLDQLGIDRAHLRPQHGRRGDAGARREPSRPGALAGAGLSYRAAGRAARGPHRPGQAGHLGAAADPAGLPRLPGGLPAAVPASGPLQRPPRNAVAVDRRYARVARASSSPPSPRRPCSCSATATSPRSGTAP